MIFSEDSRGKIPRILPGQATATSRSRMRFGTKRPVSSRNCSAPQPPGLTPAWNGGIDRRLVDVLENVPEWVDWSIAHLRAQAKIHRLAINPIIYLRRPGVSTCVN